MCTFAATSHSLLCPWSWSSLQKLMKVLDLLKIHEVLDFSSFINVRLHRTVSVTWTHKYLINGSLVITGANCSKNAKSMNKDWKYFLTSSSKSRKAKDKTTFTQNNAYSLFDEHNIYHDSGQDLKLTISWHSGKINLAKFITGLICILEIFNGWVS